MRACFALNVLHSAVLGLKEKSVVVTTSDEFELVFKDGMFGCREALRLNRPSCGICFS
jgi:hypothetical protein